MGEVIYHIKPFNAFIGSLGTILFFFLIGGLGVLTGLLSRKERIVIRVIMLVVGGFLVVIGILMSVNVFQEYTSGAVPFIAQLEGKGMEVSNGRDDVGMIVLVPIIVRDARRENSILNK